MTPELLRLLLIEDNPIDASVIQHFLAHTNGMHIESEHAERLSTGLARLADGRFDAVLVDLNLPDSSGLDTVVRTHACNPRVPIVVLTGENADELALQAVKAGAEDYLCKSELEPRLLVRSIRYAIERAAHRRSDLQIQHEESIYRELLSAVTTYTYSVKFHNGIPISTQHTLGCLSATGYSPEEYAADPYLWIEMVHPDDRANLREHVAKVHAGERVPPVEHRILHKDGSIRWVRSTIITRYDENAALVAYDGLVEDISARKRAEQALRERDAHLLAAQEIQKHLWPAAPPSLPGFDIAGAAYPAEFAAGDYFDYIPMLDGSLGLVIGDVAGHGLGPAIVMALAYAHLRSLARVHNGTDEILTRVNEFLVDETDPFVTLLFVRLYPHSRMLAWTNAGHPPGMVLDAAGNVKSRMEATTIPLAIRREAQFTACGTTKLEPGDIVLLLTDGGLEARSPAGAAFGLQRAIQVVAANRSRPACEIVEALYRAVLDFCAQPQPLDDITLIVFKVVADGRPE